MPGPKTTEIENEDLNNANSEVCEPYTQPQVQAQKTSDSPLHPEPVQTDRLAMVDIEDIRFENSVGETTNSTSNGRKRKRLKGIIRREFNASTNDEQRGKLITEVERSSLTFTEGFPPLQDLTESQKRSPDSQIYQGTSVPSFQERRLRTCYGINSPIKSVDPKSDLVLLTFLFNRPYIRKREI